MSNTDTPGDTTQRVVIDVVAPAPKLTGIDTSINKLRTLEAAIFNVGAEYDKLLVKFKTASGVTLKVPKAPTIPPSWKSAPTFSPGSSRPTPPPPVMVKPSILPSGSNRPGVGGRDIVEATSHLAQWASSAAVLYGGLNLVRSGIDSVVERQYQIARLTQVFRGSRLEVMGLADDVLKLAANNGRSAKEAMESAIQWSRMGFTRSQVNEAVRASLIAANTAELSAGDATERLSSIMAGYGLRVYELAGALGQLNDVSNKVNASSKDLLDGLARVAPVARQAGLSYAETIGIIGGARGSTGLTGATLGQGLKSIIGSLADPRKQEFLRNQYKIEVSTDGSGEIKNMSELLQELFLAYQRLTASQQQNLVFTVAGKTQAARLTAILDSYVKAQVLAISAQNNLNSAESENEKIVASLKAQLTGLVTEWDRFVNLQAKRGPTEALSQISQAFTNVLHLLNTPGGSMAATGFLAVLTVMAAKLAVVSVGMVGAASGGNFVTRSFAGVKNAALGMSAAMNMAVNQFYAANIGAGALSRGIAIATANLNLFGQGAILNGRAMGGFLGAGFIAAGAAARTLAVAIAGLVSAAVPLLVIWGGLETFNYLMSLGSKATEEAERKMNGFASEAERASKAANATADAIKLLSTVSRALPDARPEIRGQMIEQVSSVAYDDPGKSHALKMQLESLIAQKKIAEAQQVLEGVRNDLTLRRMVLLGKELGALDDQKKALQDQISVIKEKNAKSGENNSRKKALEEKENQLAELNSRRTAKLIEGGADNAADLDARLANDVKHLAFMERERLLAESIKEIYAEISGPGHVDRLNAESAAIVRTIEHNKAVLAALQNDPEVAAKEKAEREKALRQNAEDQKAAMAAVRKLDAESARLGAQGLDENKFRTRKDQLDVLAKIAEDMPLGTGKVRMGAESLSDAIGNVFSGSSADQRKQMQELIEKRDALQNHLTGLSRARAELENSPLAGGPVQANQKRIDEITERNRKLEADYAARASEGPRTLAEFRDAATQAGAFTRNIISSSGIGDDEAQRLNSQIRYAEALADQQLRLAQYDSSRADSNYRILIAMNAVNQAQDLSLQKEQMRAKLAADVLNINREARREYERSLLTAGPGDLLRKMAVNQLGGGGMSAGGFFAMGGDARADWLQMTGGTRLADARRQLGELGGPGGGGLDVLKGQIARLTEWTRQRASLMGRLKLDVPGEGNISEKAIAAAGALESLKFSANGLAGAFELLKGRADALFANKGGNVPTLAQANH